MSSSMNDSQAVKMVIERDVQKAIDDLYPLTIGQLGALVYKLGGKEVAERILRNELHLVVEDKQAYLLETAGKLADRNGRIISSGLPWLVVNPEYLADYTSPEGLWDAHTLLQAAVNATGLAPERFLSSQRLEEKLEKLRDLVAFDGRIRYLLKGSRALAVPVVLPKVPKGDYLEIVRECMLPVLIQAANRYSSECHFGSPEITLQDWRVESMVLSNRHERLFLRLQCESVAGIMFPLAFRGFSAAAALEAEQRLPENASVAGLLDGFMALALCPGWFQYAHVVFPAVSHVGKGTYYLRQRSPFPNSSFQRVDSGTHPLKQADRYLDSGLLFVAD